jgi:RNA polymerase sigma factor (sigma-70 family)
MAEQQLGDVLQHLHKLVGFPDESQADAELLRRFVARREEAAFAALVDRHGPMVLGVCRRVLGDDHEADDAFQATFFVLVRRAAAIRKQTSLASWLHGVALRVAVRARAAVSRRRAHERQGVDMLPDKGEGASLPVEPAASLRPLLDEELARLPEKYRAPLVLCYLEGKTHAQAAQELGWPTGSMSRRLARGRELLRQRLVQRGVTLSAGLFTAALAQGTAPAALPAALAGTTVRGALLCLAGEAAASVSPTAAALVKGVLHELFLARLKVVVALALAVGLAGAGLLLGQRPEGGGQPPGGTPPSSPEARPAADSRTPAADRYGDPLPPGARARLGTLLFRHGSHIDTIAISPGGKTLVLGSSYNNRVRLTDAATGKTIRELPGPGHVASVAFAPDGKSLAAAGHDGQGKTVRVWDAATGKELHAPSVNPGVRAIAFSPDSKTLAGVGTSDRKLHLWEVATGKEVRQIAGHEHDVLCVAFSGDGKTLASGSHDGTLRLWDTATGKELGRIKGHQDEFYHVAFAPDGKTVAAGDEAIRLWEVGTGKEIRRVAGGGLVCFSPDGKLLAALSGHGKISLWEVSTGKEAHMLTAPAGGIRALVFSADGATLVSASPWSINLWDVATGKERHPFQAHATVPDAVVFSPDGKLLASGDLTTIYVWDVAAARAIRKLEVGEYRHGNLAFSPDGKTLAWADSDSIRLWDLSSGKEVRRLQGFPLNVSTLAYSPDGKSLTALSGGTLFQWDPATGQEVRREQVDRDGPAAVAFSPDGETLATVIPSEKTIRLRDTDREEKTPGRFGKELRQLHGHESWVMFLAFSPDGRLLVSGSGDRTVRVWEVSTGKELHRFGGHKNHVFPVAFTPDSRLVAITDGGETVHLRDLATGKKVHEIAGHLDTIWSLAFSPDGKTLASGSQDTTVMLWDMAAILAEKRPPQPRPQAKELEALWGDLAGEDVPRAYRAIGELAAARAAPLLGERLRTPPEVDPRRLGRLIAELDSDQFEERERATAELEKLGPSAEPALRKALAGQPSAELRRRAEKLLLKLQRRELSSEQVRALRALQALEWMGTPEARQVLKALAGGPPEAWLTREAKATRERVNRRPPSPE